MEIKIAETAMAVMQGADEIDVVINLGYFLEENYDELTEELQEIKVRLKPFMVSECGRHGITRVYFMLTNIMDESSDVIYYGEGSEEMGKIAFQQEPEDKCFHLKGVVSRKKQMIPAMMEAAQIMANDFN